MWGVLKNLMKVVLVEPDVTEDDVNVLLFGNSGTGNSTVINSIWNYFKYPIFRAARGNIETVTHDSEVYSVDEGLKVYKLPIKMDLKTFNLILIDTPPVGNPRGIEQDNTNMENILGYLATLKKLHAVCFVFKAHETRVTKFMEYCLKQMLTRLDRSAKEDIIFITVYNETSRYTAEETKHHCLVPLVRGIRSNPPRIRIGLNNVFALDNEAFRALLKIQEGKRYNRHELDGFARSWETSSKEIRRLLTYITTLESLDLQNIISINEVRFLVEQLATCISEISERIQDNMKSLDTHQKRLTTEDQAIQQLKPQLYITCVGLEVKHFDE
ncbi:hypothetical protein Zmor_012691 [Zophobas morio]|uniref:G domain-containing protein n=1 Tax=Zophobas morio TaxID=2755281 RepID=A0AA38MEX6_9CUCU|nr:hypothetical protein Zmor_012691 [Zophobas morio]